MSAGGAAVEIGVAFVGGGMVSDLHREAVATMPGLRLVGVHDADAAVTEKRAVGWGVRGYDGLDALLADDAVGAVYVLTPPPTHVPIARRCLDAGRHVLVEKPVAEDPAEIEALAAAAARAGRVAMPAHNYAYMPEFARMLRLAGRGELGTIRSLWITYAIKHPEAVAAAYGGVLDEVMIHHAYLALALLGPPSRVFAGSHEPAWERHPVEDQAWMVWEYPAGTTTFLFATFAADDESADPWTFVVKILGTEGSATLSWRSAVFRNRMTSWFAHGFPLYEETYRQESSAFAAAIAGGVPPVSDLAAAATSARILRAAAEAAARHEPVARAGDPAAEPRW